MNRRNFFRSLVALPFSAAAAGIDYGSGKDFSAVVFLPSPVLSKQEIEDIRNELLRCFCESQMVKLRLMKNG